jgi:hypothetical protein
MISIMGRRRLRTVWLRGAGAAAFLIVTAAVAGGCGNDGGGNSVASVPTPSSHSAPAGAGSGGGNLAEYAKCLRQNGLPNFPDPNADGTLSVPQGIDPNSKQFKDADAKCAQYKPPGDPQQNNGQPPGGGWSMADKLKYAKCMRDHGVTGFSDPDANGNFSMRKGDGPDPDSPQYKAAEEACKQSKGSVPEGAPQQGPGA